MDVAVIREYASRMTTTDRSTAAAFFWALFTLAAWFLTTPDPEPLPGWLAPGSGPARWEMGR